MLIYQKAQHIICGILFILLCLPALTFSRNDVHSRNPEAVDTFPVPTFNKNTLFYVQRTVDINTIMYDLNMENGVLNESKPLNIYWIRYAKNKEKEKLSYIQDKYAFGIRHKKVGHEQFLLTFAGYSKIPIVLKKLTDGKYYALVNHNGYEIILQRIYIKVEPGGSLWLPNISYLLLKGKDIKTGKMIEYKVMAKK